MGKRIVLISCASQKLPHPAKVKNLYKSTLFKLSLKYAEKLTPDEIFVLSAKHGLLRLDEEIEPYEHTLNKMSSKNIKLWANHVITQLRDVCIVEDSKFIFLAGDKYRRYLLPQLRNYEIPLKGLDIGKQLQKLKEMIVS